MVSTLGGLRVIDCSDGVAGPMAAMLLADFGADVIKIESPDGDPARGGAGFPAWNRNKRGITIDLDNVHGRERLRALLEDADVCLFNRPFAELEPLGFDPASLHVVNPSLVYLHLPPFANEGPGGALPESAELLSAACGVSLSQYSFDDVPVDPVIPHVLYGQAIWAAAAASAALFERNRSGFGQTVTVGGLHGVLVTMTGSITQRPGASHQHSPGGPGGPIPFYRLYECQDGQWLFMAGLTPAFYTAALSMLGVLEEILADARLGGELMAMALPENAPWVIHIIARAFRTRPRNEWLGILREAGCPCGPVWDRETWFDHEQVRAIGMRVALEDSERGSVEMPGISLNLTRSPAVIRTPAPRLGQHNGEVIERPPRSGPKGPAPGRLGPLAGTTVLDLGSIIAGTYAGSLLAELGADVVKVESLSGDNLRAFAPTFVGYNLGKRSLALDLRSEPGREVFYRLAKHADIVVDNYRPGVLDRLKIDYASLVGVNPDIITVSVTGYGEGGPLGGEPGFDPLLQAASGMMHAQGGHGDPVFFALPVNDVASAAMASLGAILALLYRDRTGEGQRVWTSLAGQSVIMQCAEMVRFRGRPPARIGGRDFAGASALDRFYKVKDGWIRLQATTPEHRRALYSAGFLPDGYGETWTKTAPEPCLSEVLGGYSRDDAIDRLRLAGVPAAPVRSLAELVTNSQFLAADAVHLHTLANGSSLWTAGRYARFSRTEIERKTRPPGLGEHTLEVLQQAGCSANEIEELLAEGVVGVGAPFVLNET